MKKLNSITLFFLLICATSLAQNNVGIGTTNPNQHAILELNSSTQGLLLPRLLTLPTDPSLPTGLLAYKITSGPDAGLNIREGGQWKQVVQAYDGSNFALSNQICPTGRFSRGVNGSGNTICQPLPINSQSCPSGQFVRGFTSIGSPICGIPSLNKNSTQTQVKEQSETERLLKEEVTLLKDKIELLEQKLNKLLAHQRP